MKLEEFVETVKRGDIPQSPPNKLNVRGYSGFIFGERLVDYMTARQECTERGMWALVYKDWVVELAEWIGDRTVLEIMAGRGWLAKALAAEGIDIAATDNGGWDERHMKNENVFPVTKQDAVQAAKTSERDILLVSWPPCEDAVVHKACSEWNGPIIYIGESHGGCNAPYSFWARFQEDKSVNIPLVSWNGIHDYVFIGRYSESES